MAQPPANQPPKTNPPQQVDGQQPWWSTPGAVMPGQAAGQPPSPVPSVPPPGTPQAFTPQPGPIPEGGQAFGFDAAPKDEKYNTEYLVQNLSHDRKRSQMIVIGVLIAAVLGVLTWLALSPKDTGPNVPQTQAIPLDTPPAKAAAPAGATEAKPAEPSAATPTATPNDTAKPSEPAAP